MSVLPTKQTFGERSRPFRWLLERELLRIYKLWTQTIIAPVVSSFLFILVFGLSLGDRIKAIDGVTYDVYIVPGLIAMAMVQSSFSNSSTSVFQARFDRYIHDILAAPMRTWEINLGMALGGVLRGLTIGILLLLASLFVVDVPVREPGFLILAVLVLLVMFSFFGVVVGLYAESFDHHQFVNNIILLPLTFLGGVFYSVNSLSPIWEAVTHANPIFYLVQTVRYGFLGRSDVDPWLALGVTTVMAIVALVWSSYLFATGKRLKA
ncbi:MAG TPA: ABC transporter permease [Baekduia sp.]|nr:ABC transporter permease [Baekduia sp.]